MTLSLWGNLTMLALAMFTSFAMAQTFNMYPDVDATALASALGFSTECLSAFLCTDDCLQSSSQWFDAIYADCADTDTIAIDKKLVPADSIAIRYSDGIGLACMTDLDLDIQSYDIPPSSTTTGSPTSSSTVTLPSETPTDIPSPNVTVTLNNSTGNFSYCWLESQSWVGQDPDPDCAADPTNVFCTDPDSQKRIANVYNDTILCSNCFLSVLWWRINSPFLPDTDYSDYLIEQFQDIKDVCNVTMPDSLIRTLPSYAAAPSPTILPPGTDPNENVAQLGSSAQPAGLVIHSPQSMVYLLEVFKQQQARQCESDMCFDSKLIGWRSEFQGQYICIGPPGGGYTLPPPINGTDTTSSDQNRGGQGPQGVTPTANSTLSAPSQDGIASDCNAFAYATTGDTCFDMSQRFSITLAQLTTWNPVLGYPDGHNCTTQFWAGYDYCVGVPGSGSTTTTTTSKTTTTSSLPFPTQSGIDPNCNSYAEAVTGDYCFKFASDHNITTDQLYAWNKILGANGADCSTQFQAGYDYCVGVATTSTTTTTPTTTTSPPIPTQTGLAANCNKIVVAQSGDFCFMFAQENNISTAQLYAWNPVLGPNGENCSTQFQAGYGYCFENGTGIGID
ncbi:hypothetical protein ONZ43_g37 [Nemania bipapillata]|uniref:Uncharacterized protein n=1 Tax=Nemania bipapillata TaxID=110536 RepID=A0ACC2JA29_9PEZI|nr:hypothetical protein ONZ43_g37 [Nemania bipapillata]